MDYLVTITTTPQATITVPATTQPRLGIPLNNSRSLYLWATNNAIGQTSTCTVVTIETVTPWFFGPAMTLTFADQTPELADIDQALAAYGFTPMTTDANQRHHTRRDATLDELIAIMTETHPTLTPEARDWLDRLPELTRDPHHPDTWLTRRTDDTDDTLTWHPATATWDR